MINLRANQLDYADGTGNRIAVLGLGNELMGDDGIGVYAVRELMGRDIDGVDCYEVGTAMLGSLDLLERYRYLIAIDAMQAGGTPGSLYRLAGAEALAAGWDSVHDLGLGAAMAMTGEERCGEVVLLGVEPEELTLRMELSATLGAILPEVLAAAVNEIKRMAAADQGEQTRTGSSQSGAKR